MFTSYMAYASGPSAQSTTASAHHTISKEAKEAKEAKGDTKADRQKAALERLRNIKKKRPLVATAAHGEVNVVWGGWSMGYWRRIGYDRT